MSFARVITVGERPPGGRWCIARDGTCSCGWQAPETAADTGQATLDHLYGDLTGAARHFAYTGERLTRTV